MPNLPALGTGTHARDLANQAAQQALAARTQPIAVNPPPATWVFHVFLCGRKWFTSGYVMRYDWVVEDILLVYEDSNEPRTGEEWVDRHINEARSLVHVDWEWKGKWQRFTSHWLLSNSKPGKPKATDISPIHTWKEPRRCDEWVGRLRPSQNGVHQIWICWLIPKPMTIDTDDVNSEIDDLP